jgi:glycosyltransferase involved in cell wall biosynthesis
MPHVSVIMPCFNHATYVAAAMRSVLDQTHRDLELIVVDDCSSDGSWETISKLAGSDSRITAIRHSRNQGVSKTRNDALDAARGEWIAFCDADDVWEPEKTATQLALLNANPSYQVTYCDSLIIDELGYPTGQRFSSRYPPPGARSRYLLLELITKNFINTQTVLMHQECLARVGGFDEDLRVLEDWWYWMRLSSHFQFLYSTDCLAKYRVHRSSTNRLHNRTYIASRFKVLARLLHNHRELSPRARADAFFNLGVNLCELGRRRTGVKVLRQAIALSLVDPRAFGILVRALRRILMKTDRCPAGSVAQIVPSAGVESGGDGSSASRTIRA